MSHWIRGLCCLVFCIASISWGSLAGVVEGHWTATPSAVARGEILLLGISLDNTSASAIANTTLSVPLPLGADQWTAEVRADGGIWEPYPANGLIALDPLPALGRREVEIRFRIEVGSPARLAFVAQLLTTSGVLLELAGTTNVLPSVDAGPDLIVVLGAPCHLVDASASDGGGEIAGVEWTDHGVGGGFDDPYALHPTYVPPAASGVYELTLTAVDVDAGSCSDSLRVRVNAPPWVDAGGDLDAVEGALLDLPLIDLADPDGWIEEIRWSDGGAGGTFLPTDATENPVYVVPLIDGCADDSITLTVTVTDEWGASFSDTLIVSVQNVNTPPQVSVPEDETTTSGETVTLHASATDADGSIVSQSWSQVGGPDVAFHVEGAGTEVRFIAPEMETAGNLWFRFTAVDNCGARVERDVEVHVIPRDGNDDGDDGNDNDDGEGDGGEGDYGDDDGEGDGSEGDAGDESTFGALSVGIDVLDARGVSISPLTPPACGQAVSVRVSVLNTGTSKISGLTGTLDSGEALTLMASSLEPWSSTSGICEWIVPTWNDSEPLRLEATVCGIDADGHEVVACCTYAFEGQGVAAAPALTFSVQASTASAAVGDTVTFAYSVVNSGGASLLGLTLDDDGFGRIDLSRSDLAPGESVEVARSYTVRSTDMPDTLVHSALARAFTEDGICVEAEAGADVALTSAAGGGGASGRERIVFSEIAWAGTAVDPAAEWIELANLGTDSVNVDGWTIAWYEKTGDVPARETWHSIELSGVIEASADTGEEEEAGPRFLPAGDGVWTMSDPRWTSERADGYYLLERGNDDVVANVRADQIYGSSADTYYDLPDAGAAVFLLDAEGNVVDSANAQYANATGWIAGQAATGATMERINLSLGDYAANWQTSPGILTYGVDATGHPLTGTAGQPNACPLDELTERVQADLSPTISAATVSATLTDIAESRPSIYVTTTGTRSTGGGGAVSAPAVATMQTSEALHLTVDLSVADDGDYCIWIGLENGCGMVLPLRKAAE